MTLAAKVAAYSVALLMLAGGLWLWASAGVGWPLIAIGLLVIVGTALERRYRGSAAVERAAWQRTGERFVDDESGELIEVWYEPASGRRDYRPVAR